MTNRCAKFQPSSLSGSCFMAGGGKNLPPRVSSRAKSPGLIGLKNITIPKLSTEDVNKCEGRLSIKECWDTLQSFENNKSHGNDGLSKEFYVWWSPSLDLNHCLSDR